MSLSNNSINVSQLLVFREILELLSDPEKKKKLLSEAADLLSKAQQQEMKAIDAMGRLAVIDSESAKKKADADDLMAKAKSLLNEAEEARIAALKDKEESSKIKSVLLKEHADFKEKTKSSLEEIELQKKSLSELQLACVKAKEAARLLGEEYKEKTEKLKKALGE